MKKIALVVFASTAALAATPAMAQEVTGTVNVKGTVGDRCMVINSGTPGATFTTSDMDLGQLNAADGTLISQYATSTVASPAGSRQVRVICTSAKPTIGLLANKLSNGGGTAATGYANDIDYLATLKVKTVSGTDGVLDFDTTTGATTEKTLKLGSRIAGASGDNVEVIVSNLATVGGSSNVLNAGSYTSTVSVSIKPTF